MPVPDERFGVELEELIPLINVFLLGKSGTHHMSEGTTSAIRNKAQLLRHISEETRKDPDTL